MLRTALILLAAATMFAPGPAGAQTSVDPGGDLFGPGLVGPNMNFGLDSPPGDFDPTPYAPSEPPPPAPFGAAEYDLMLQALLVEGGEPLEAGVTWRVFSTEPAEDGQLRLLATARGGGATVSLAPGEYLVHAAFGRAGATKKVSVAGDDRLESLVLDAGGLQLDAIVGDDKPVPLDRLTFEILQENDGGDLVTIVPEAEARKVLRLGAGTYHVISRYGGVNAVVRADIQVEAGRLTEAVMRHTAAEVTLKLVAAEGGEALANTSWTVLTQDGATVHESVGAFPSLVLAEGNYSAVASHREEIFSRDFAVEAGIDRDIEVRLTDLVQPEAEKPPIPEAAAADGP